GRPFSGSAPATARLERLDAGALRGDTNSGQIGQPSPFRDSACQSRPMGIRSRPGREVSDSATEGVGGGSVLVPSSGQRILVCQTVAVSAELCRCFPTFYRACETGRSPPCPRGKRQRSEVSRPLP